jgi:hypothetical protein
MTLRSLVRFLSIFQMLNVNKLSLIKLKFNLLNNTRYLFFVIVLLTHKSLFCIKTKISSKNYGANLDDKIERRSGMNEIKNVNNSKFGNPGR